MIKSTFISLALALLTSFVPTGLALAQSCAGGTFENLSNTSTATLIDTANGQCLINFGSISPPSGGYGLFASFNNFTIKNLGSINLSGVGASALTTNGFNTPPTTSGYIYNAGTIIASGTSDIYAIWPFNNTGTINSIVNSGSIQMNNTGQSVGIFIYSGNIVNELTNSGSISVVGSYGAIGNNGNIATLNNGGSIVSTGMAHGIVNNSFMGTVNNTGTISAITSGFYAINNLAGAITTLNNSQGTNNTALTYTGELPENYNIIIGGISSYGQLAATSATGSTTFGIYSGSTLANGNYSSVLSGIAVSNLTGATRGNYEGFTWSLSQADVIGGIWNLIVTGASTADTQSSLAKSAASLRSVYNQQAATLNNSLSYDCQMFAANGICVSAGGRVARADATTGSSSSSLLIAAFRARTDLRVGAFIDQDAPFAGPTEISLDKSPMYGVFGVWNANPSLTGLEVRLGASWSNSDITQTRSVVGSSEAGVGTSSLASQAVSAVVSYGLQVPDSSWSTKPYAGIRNTRITRKGYTESNAVTAPLTYSNLRQGITTALAGVRLSKKISNDTEFVASAGVERNIGSSFGALDATGIVGLTPTDFKNNLSRTRPVASAGVSYAVAKDQRIGVMASYRQEPFRSAGSVTALVLYQMGLY